MPAPFLVYGIEGGRFFGGPMLSALGNTFSLDLSTATSHIGATVASYILLAVGIVLAVIVVNFVLHFIRSKVSQ